MTDLNGLTVFFNTPITYILINGVVAAGKSLEGLPLEGFDYESILGQCCEMPVGYVQIPVGIAGPLLLDGMEFMVPMATTEGCLVASTNRGCKAINASGGATSVLLKDGMTRAPVVRFATAKRAADLKFFLEEPLNFETLASVFNRLESRLFITNRTKTWDHVKPEGFHYTRDTTFLYLKLHGKNNLQSVFVGKVRIMFTFTVFCYEVSSMV